MDKALFADAMQLSGPIFGTIKQRLLSRVLLELEQAAKRV